MPAPVPFHLLPRDIDIPRALALASPEQLAQARAEIARLPQAKHIHPEVAERWLATVCAIEPDRLVWHARRLRGFGGSEIGALVMGARGDYNPFTSPRDLVMSKLMLAAPDGGNGHTRRGTELEPVIRKSFRAIYKATPREDIMEAMCRVKHPKLPWLVGNPDDVVEISARRYMVDYKAPSQKTFDEMAREGKVKFEYAAQLHQMAMVCEQTSAMIDGLLLCSWDINNWRPFVMEVERDSALEADIVSAGQFYWNDYVLAGKIPETTSQSSFDLETFKPEVAAELEQLALEHAAARQLSTVARHHAEQCAARATLLSSSYAIGKARVELAGSVIKAKPKLNEDEVFRLAARHRLTIDEDALSDRSFAEAQRLLAELETAVGDVEDLSRCFIEEHSMEVTRQKSGAAAELIAREKTAANNLLDQFIERARAAGVSSADVLDAAQAPRVRRARAA